MAWGSTSSRECILSRPGPGLGSPGPTFSWASSDGVAYVARNAFPVSPSTLRDLRSLDALAPVQRRELASVCGLIEKLHGPGAVRFGSGQRVKTRKRRPSFRQRKPRPGRPVVLDLGPWACGTTVAFNPERVVDEFGACCYELDLRCEVESNEDLDEIVEQAELAIEDWQEERRQRRAKVAFRFHPARPRMPMPLTRLLRPLVRARSPRSRRRAARIGSEPLARRP